MYNKTCTTLTIAKPQTGNVHPQENCWAAMERSWNGILLSDTRRSNQSILKEIDPEYALEGLMLKLQYFGHLIRRTDSLEKTLMLGKTEGRGRSLWQRARGLDIINGHEFEPTLGDSEGQGSLACCSPWGCKEMDIDLGTEQQQQRYKVNKLHVWILKTRSWTRECRHKRAHSVWFQAHEI